MISVLWRAGISRTAVLSAGTVRFFTAAKSVTVKKTKRKTKAKLQLTTNQTVAMYLMQTMSDRDLGQTFEKMRKILETKPEARMPLLAEIARENNNDHLNWFYDWLSDMSKNEPKYPIHHGISKKPFSVKKRKSFYEVLRSTFLEQSRESASDESASIVASPTQRERVSHCIIAKRLLDDLFLNTPVQSDQANEIMATIKEAAEELNSTDLDDIEKYMKEKLTERDKFLNSEIDLIVEAMKSAVAAIKDTTSTSAASVTESHDHSTPRVFDQNTCHYVLIKCRKVTTTAGTTAVPVSGGIDVTRGKESHADVASPVNGSMCDPSLKVLVQEIPPNVDEAALAKALHRCGEVSHVHFVERSVIVSVNDVSPTTILDTVETEGAEKGAKSEEKKPKKRMKKTRNLKDVLKADVFDGHAFVWMKDGKGFQNVTRDDMRIFGVTINGSSCHINASVNYRTLILEVKETLRLPGLTSMLSAVLGNAYKVELNTTVDPTKKPLFAQLRFESHAEAWRAFAKLEAASFATKQQQQQAPFKVSWVRGSAYWAAAAKEKERKLLKTEDPLLIHDDGSSAPEIHLNRPLEGAIPTPPEAT